MSKHAAPATNIDAPPPDLFGFSAIHLDEVDSTSDEAARRLRARTLSLPAVVVADVQTTGRGTRGRTWLSAAGGLTATFVLPVDPSRPVHHLPLLVGLAVRDALADIAGPGADSRLKVKWPNDVLLDGRKLAGILCERRDGADLVGVGANLSVEAATLPAELRDRLASFSEIRPTSRAEVLAAVARRFAGELLAASATLAERHDDLRRHDFLRGKEVEVETPTGRVTGRCDGVDVEGRLLVAGNGGVDRIVSGTICRDDP